MVLPMNLCGSRLQRAWPIVMAVLVVSMTAWLGLALPSDPGGGAAARGSGAWVAGASVAALVAVVRGQARWRAGHGRQLLFAACLLAVAMAFFFLPPFFTSSPSGPRNGPFFQAVLWCCGLPALGAAVFLVVSAQECTRPAVRP